jgi:hypothetical protein
MEKAKEEKRKDEKKNGHMRAERKSRKKES